MGENKSISGEVFWKMKKNIKNDGSYGETIILKLIKSVFREDKISHHKTWGADITIENDAKEIIIEVKTAHYKVKNGKKGMRTGKFYFIPQNLERPDFYAFIIYFPTKVTSYWVRKEVIAKYFAFHTKRTKLSLGIPTFLTHIPKTDFSEVIQEWV